METPIGPGQVRCQTTLSGQPSTIPPNGGTVSVTVNAARDCAWTATSEAAWMQLNSTSGQGDATLSVTVARNELPAARSGAIAVNDQRFMVSQEPRPCTYELRPMPQSFGPEGGTGSISIETLTGCAWSASSSVPWLRVTTASGSGSGAVSFEVAGNDAGAREGSITIAGQGVTINQDAAGQPAPGPNCAILLAPTTIPAVVAASTHTVTLTTNPPCEWRATSSAPSWLTVAPASGRGSTTLTLTVARNNGNARSATVSVGTQNVTVSQAAAPACTVTIDPPSSTFQAPGGEGRVTVTTQDGCEWTAAVPPNVSWISFTSGGGTGRGEARFTVAQNAATTSRSATLSIGGRNHSVTQQGATPTCTYSISASPQNFSAGTGSGSFTVTTQDGCAWTASAGAGWVTNGPWSGTGTRTMNFSVQANNGAARQTSIALNNGPSVNISQEAPAPACTYSISASPQNFGAGPGGGSFTVTTQDGCAWTASAGAGWVGNGPWSGSGTQTMSFSVQANNGAARQTSIALNAGPSVNISQEAPAPTCTYSISASPQSFGAGPGGGSFTVTTQEGCAWTASSGAGWVTNGPWNGSGTQTMSFSVQPNAGAARQTSIALNTGPSVNISQEAAAPTCTYSISASPQSFGAGAGGGSLTVTTQEGCAWTASAGAGWVTNGPWSGSGTQTMSFSVQPNTGAARQTTISLGTGQSVTLTQEAAAPTCTYSISASPQSFGAGAGGGSFTVTTQDGCAWTASAGAGWLTNGPWSGSGTQTMSFSVQPNSGGARQTSIALNTGPSVTISQEAAAPTCTYSLSASPQNFAAGGGGGSLTVSTQTGCAWTASAGAGWVTNGPWSGSGTETVSFSVQPNTGAARQTLISLGTGQSVTITQELGTTPQACTFTIRPPDAEFGPRGGQGTVNVVASAPTCAWTASESVDWIALGSSGGTGNRQVSYTVAPYDGDDDDRREAIITIAGQSHRVRQDGDEDSRVLVSWPLPIDYLT